MELTKAIIDLGAMRKNIKKIRRKVGRNVKILICVKANAYGHGIEEVSDAIKEDIDYFGVASVEEGVMLRKIGITLPILILRNIFPEEAKEVVAYNLSQSLCSLEVADALNREAERRNKKIKVHINIDTGMGGMGVKPEEVLNFVEKVGEYTHLYIEGIFTHFPSADEMDKSFTYQQIEAFRRLTERIEKGGINIPFKHTANSAAILDIPDSYFNMIRPGIIAYGYYPSPYVRKTIRVDPALSLTTKIVFLRGLSKGMSISYGRTYITTHISQIATLPIGYGDGYSRFLSNKGEVIIHGRRAPIVGRVCMDQTMVDVTKLRDVKIGDGVVLIGRSMEEEITVEEIALRLNTIPHEIVTMIGERIPRIYLED